MKSPEKNSWASSLTNSHTKLGKVRIGLQERRKWYSKQFPGAEKWCWILAKTPTFTRMLLQLGSATLGIYNNPASTIRRGAKSHKLLFFSPILQSLLQTQELFKLNHRLESSIMSSTIWWCCGLQCSSDIPDIPWAPLYVLRPVFIQSPCAQFFQKSKCGWKLFNFNISMKGQLCLIRPNDEPTGL